jgi:hypothetical protein
MASSLVKPLALVDNRTGHLMLLVDARTLETELDGGLSCRLRQDEGRFLLDIKTRPEATSIGPFSKSEADKLRLCHRLTVAAFRDGVVIRARELSLEEIAA